MRRTSRRVEVRRQAERRVVRGRDHLVLGLEARHRHDRAEGLFAGTGHRGVGADQQRRRKVVGAERRQALATDDDACARARRASCTWRSILSTARALIIGPICEPASLAGPDLQRRDARGELVDEARRARPPARTRGSGSRRSARRCGTCATISPSTAASRSASSKTMNGALPPSSSESFFSVSADAPREVLAHRRRAGEADLAHARVVEPDVDHLGRALARGGHDVQHAGRHAGLLGQLDERERGQRRVLGRLARPRCSRRPAPARSCARSSPPGSSTA